MFQLPVIWQIECIWEKGKPYHQQAKITDAHSLGEFVIKPTNQGRRSRNNNQQFSPEPYKGNVIGLQFSLYSVEQKAINGMRDEVTDIADVSHVHSLRWYKTSFTSLYLTTLLIIQQQHSSQARCTLLQNRTSTFPPTGNF